MDGSTTDSLSFQGVSKSFGTTAVLHDLTVALTSGLVTAVVGASGCGKSTLLRIGNGLLRADRGTVRVLGETLGDAMPSSVRKRVGYAVQGTGLFPHLTARQNIVIAAELNDWDASRIESRLEQLLALMHLSPELLQRHPHELSGGQQQRVGLCRAMMMQPELLFLDEPFAAIDAITRMEIHEQLLELLDAEPATVVLVTHDMREAFTLADEILVLGEGQVLRHQSVAELREEFHGVRARVPAEKISGWWVMRRESREWVRFIQDMLLAGTMLVSCFGAYADTYADYRAPIRVAAKSFTEASVLGEIVAQLLESRGFTVERRFTLGGTLVAFEALSDGEVDLYAEYSGTITRAILKAPELAGDAMEQALAERGLRFKPRLGFNNNYALAVPEKLASELGLTTISDLASHPSLSVAVSHEFLNRDDGWPALRARYELPQTPVGIEHALAYRALAGGDLDVTDAYTTDGDLARYAVRLLEDDRGLFPAYEAGLLVRDDLDVAVLEVLGLLEGRIDETTMQLLNARVASDGVSPAAAASGFMQETGLATADAVPDGSLKSDILRNTLVHLQLTGVSLLLACVIAIPLALLVSRDARTSNALGYGAGLIQTIPALALLALLIPVLGLGTATAITALFLYSLLPIVRNTLTGLTSVDPLLIEIADSLGLTPTQRVLRIQLPLALPMILAGIKTAAIISIGTATLAAFVGAGGLGQPIITGLTLNDHRLILEGAVPAALLAIVVEFVFEALDRRLIPVYLRPR